MADNLSAPAPTKCSSVSATDEPVDHGTVTVDSAARPDRTRAPSASNRAMMRGPCCPFLDRLALVEVNFPRLRRRARPIRQPASCARLAIPGELRAVGDVLIDQN